MEVSHNRLTQENLSQNFRMRYSALTRWAKVCRASGRDAIVGLGKS